MLQRVRGSVPVASAEDRGSSVSTGLHCMVPSRNTLPLGKDGGLKRALFPSRRTPRRFSSSAATTFSFVSGAHDEALIMRARELGRDLVLSSPSLPLPFEQKEDERASAFAVL